MKCPHIIFCVAVIFSISVSAQPVKNAPPSPVKSDTASILQTVKKSPDTAIKKPDSIKTADKSDTIARQSADSLLTTRSSAIKKPDSLSRAAASADSAATAQKQADQRLKLVKRSHTGRQQVVLAACMMIFVVSIMTLAQQWNPR